MASIASSTAWKTVTPATWLAQAAEADQDHGLVRVQGADREVASRSGSAGATLSGDHDHQQGVDLVRGQQRLEHAGKVLRRCARAEVDRVARAGGPGDVPGELGAQVGGQLGHDEARGVGRVGGQHAESAGVADDGDPPAGGQRLFGQQQRGPAHRLRAAAGDDPGLREERVDADGRRSCGGGVRGAGPLTARGPAPDDGQQRFALGKPPGDPGELRRVAERLQVEGGSGDLRVVDPGGEQVVAGDVRLVAQRDERVDAEPELAGDVEQGDADAAGLRGDGEAAGRRDGCGRRWR